MDFFEEDAVGDDFEGGAELEEFDEVALVAVKGMDKGCLVEHTTVTEGEGYLFFEPMLLQAPCIKHAGGTDDVGDVVLMSEGGGHVEDGFPDAVEVDDVGGGNEAAEVGFGGPVEELVEG